MAWVICAVAPAAFTAETAAPDASAAAVAEAPPATAAGAEATAETVMSCMRANVPQQLRLRELVVRTEEADGDVRTLRARMYVMREEGRAMVTMHVESPSEVRGTSYLWRELETRDETFVFIPELNRVRRVIGSGADSGVMDSEFSMRDLQQVQGSFSSGVQHYLGEGTVEGRSVWKMRFEPGEAEPTSYTHVLADVDQMRCVTLRADFVDEKGVVKHFSAQAESLTESDGIAYARHVRMDNRRSGRKSFAEITQLEAPDDLPRRIFLPNAFYLGR
ncbi:MAG: outer membrane lipoprotein-sorting protein [Algiphilus sp.]|uniref:outer membrane lipoprotein-sorting protein n=1 Tax=Algiphilus sp. TaxID=1872431 RepID=UPI003BAC6A3B|nr:outer membrane lipoprotein-sorting protein [Algiphilus sp.]